MFFGLDLEGLQIYWWVVLSLLGGLLVFMFFVQGGQTLIDELSENELEKTMLINSLGRKWELGFTTLVLFGGAAFAAFPLFYATSFGGAYWAWLAILFCFILQAVSYEDRKKEGNIYGAKTFEIFLKINGFLGVFLIGVALSSFFSGSHFVLNEQNFVLWQSKWRGLELLANPYNYLLGFTLVFLSRILGLAYFMNNINDENIRAKIPKKALLNRILCEFDDIYLGSKGWLDDYRKYSVILGKKITVIGHSESYEALAVGIDEEGHLNVKKENGDTVTLFSGEISVRLSKKDK